MTDPTQRRSVPTIESLSRHRSESGNRFDAIVVGGGHNGLVAAAILGRAGLRVVVVEARDRLGGPCGTYEFLPGYRATFSNSPGSLEPRIVQDLDLPRFGLKFSRPDPTVVHHFPNRCFLGWRDRDKVDQQFESFSPGEAGRYHRLLESLERLARSLGISVFEPSPDMATLERRISGTSDEQLFAQVFGGGLRELLDEALESTEAKAILGMIGMAANLVPPSAPGTAIGLMLRPFSLASSPATDADDPRRIALRGSTGIPIGGMGAIIDALETCCRAHGVEIRTDTPIARILHSDASVQGVVTVDGEQITAPLVVPSVNPRILFRDMLDDDALGPDIRREIVAAPMEGSAFKIVFALDGLPSYAGLPSGIDTEQVVGSQFRIAPSLDYIEKSILDGLRGRPSESPIMWGLFPSVTSPDLTPPKMHLLSVNVWHAPYHLRSGNWTDQTEKFGQRCIEVLTMLMPDLPDRIIDHRYMNPLQLEAELNLIGSNITHGDMMPEQLFGCRPHPAISDYRTPLQGLYLTGSGTWPGGYVTGLPGYNTGHAILADLRK